MRAVSDLDLRLPDAPHLLVVPPLAHLTWPSLGVHQLQASARAAGHEVGVLYLGVLYAACIGAPTYASLCNAPVDWLLGDRLFARAAWGAPAFGYRSEAFWAAIAAHNEGRDAPSRQYLDQLSDATGETWEPSDDALPIEALRAAEQVAGALIEAVSRAIADRGYRVVGASTTFDQTAAATALLTRLEAASPATLTVLGGANCEGPMADGIAALCPAVDHVFSGESEQTWVALLDRVASGEPGSERIIRGSPCADLDALPTVDFTDYFGQIAHHLPELGDTPLWIAYETSRGCWWGAKSHCTFCGLNGQGIGFREKSADRAISELRAILAEAPTRRVAMTDNIMPHRYHKTFVPRLATELPDLHLFYEQKANLTLDQVQALLEAGNKTIQPGIEALHTELLALMRKGVSARQNIALLRYARAVGMVVKWNLLWGLPNDRVEWYREVASLLPLLRHLCPPNALTHLSIDRFSPYHDHPEAHGLTALRPLDAYFEVFPPDADVERLAYHFTADYPCGSRSDPALMASMNREIHRWRAAWEGDPRAYPALFASPVAPGQLLLLDTRGLGGPTTQFLNGAQAHAALVGGPLDRVPAARWALKGGYAAAMDGWCIPLAVSSPDVLRSLERGERPAGPDRPTLLAG